MLFFFLTAQQIADKNAAKAKDKNENNSENSSGFDPRYLLLLIPIAVVGVMIYKGCTPPPNHEQLKGEVSAKFSELKLEQEYLTFNDDELVQQLSDDESLSSSVLHTSAADRKCNKGSNFACDLLKKLRAKSEHPFARKVPFSTPTNLFTNTAAFSKGLSQFCKRSNLESLDEIFRIGRDSFLVLATRRALAWKYFDELQWILYRQGYDMEKWFRGSTVVQPATESMSEPQNTQLNDLEVNGDISEVLRSGLTDVVRIYGYTKDLDGVYQVGKNEGVDKIPGNFLDQTKELLKKYGYPSWP